MINYIVKEAGTTRKIAFENISSVGSFGMLSSYNAIGGKIGKLTYYAYYQKRVSEGYRDNSDTKAQAQYIRLNYAFSPRFNLKAELGRSQYVYHIPGPLTDSMFKQNPRQSTRQRNYYEPDIYLPSLTMDWIISKKSKIQWISSAVLGQRNSVQFIGLANVVDKIDATTLQYKPRQVDRDYFNSYTSELRWQLDYSIGKLNNTLISGVRLMNNDLHRQQLGKGTTGADYDLSITAPTYGRDVHLKTQNVALFAENLFRITPKFDLSAGVRYENGVSKMRGILSYLPTEKVPQDIKHQYPLWGASAAYRFNRNHKIYAAWSQAYRPVIFSDILPPTVLDSTDRNLKDAFGSVAEIGVKGQWSFLKYELTAFRMLYKNRIGTLYMASANKNYILKTNIGDSQTDGLELFTEATLFENDFTKIALFTSTALFDAQYLNGNIRSGSDNIDISGKRLETVPQLISRNGLQVSYKGFGAILQYSYVSKSYSDAFNLETPTANGASGAIPAYAIWDLNCSYRFNRNYVLRCGMNNIFNRQYFTKRPTIYPGQGVWSSDGRGIVVSLGIKL
jgi:Fe(3+) dicitrate transport protein